MLRGRLRRFLPTSETSSHRQYPLDVPQLSDGQVLDLLRHVDIESGSDLARGMDVYDQACREQRTLIANAEAQEASLPQATAEAPDQLSTAPQPEVYDATPVETSSALTPPTELAPANAPAQNVRADEQSDSQPQVQAHVTIISSEPNFSALARLPSFEQLIEDGWLRQSLGRFAISRDLGMAVRRQAEPGTSAFKALLASQHKTFCRLRADYSPTGRLERVASQVADGTARLSDMLSEALSPSWVTARLLEDAATRDDETVSFSRPALLRWLTQWETLGTPDFSASQYLGDAVVDAFVESSLELLDAADATPAWEEFRELARAPILLMFPHRDSGGDLVVPHVPATSIERNDWIGRNQLLTHAFHESWEMRPSTLLSALLNELETALFDARGRLAPRLMRLAVERPVYLMQLCLRAQRSPELFADMLMEPVTSALACALIVDWNFNEGGWNRDFQSPANHTTELLAFEDALAILGGHIDNGAVAVEELAALFLQTYQLATDPKRSERRFEMLSALRVELAAAQGTLQDEVVAALLRRVTESSHPLTPFCAALNLASEGSSSTRISPETAVTLYVDVLIQKGERVSVKLLSVDEARTLLTLANRCSAELRNRFLAVGDVSAQVMTGPPTPEEHHSFDELQARRVRLHIRVLARATASWTGAVPMEVIRALVRTIQVGAVDHRDRGRVDAFAFGFGYGEQWSVQERPLAQDIAAVLRRLDEPSRRTLVSELCQMTEPYVLAGLIAETPAEIHHQFKDRLNSLTPETSSEVRNIAALQARVEALLTIDMFELADAFSQAQRQANSRRVRPEQAVDDVRASLRAMFARSDWNGIASFALPAGLPFQQQRDVSDTQRFYQALAELRKPNGQAAHAEAIFNDLAGRHSAVTAYKTNLFASRLQRLLGGDSFRLLAGNDLAEGSRLLVDAKQNLRPLLANSAFDLRALDINRITLMLACGQNHECLHALLELPVAESDARTEGFKALALARTGSRLEAVALLAETESRYGRSDLLSAVHANIDVHRRFHLTTSLTITEDVVPGIRHSIEALRGLGHGDQARVLQSQGRLDLYLLEQVRGAAASVVALAPMMLPLGLERSEDNISAVLKQILLSRLLLVQWEIGDQSQGGFSQALNAGERDIVIAKGPAVLAVVEAVAIEYVERVELTSHFTKLFGYATCSSFFHLTYARRSNCAGIITHLRDMCTRPPAGISFHSFEPLDGESSEPVGLKAFYEVDARQVTVFFLVLEIGQELQRAAAAAQ